MTHALRSFLATAAVAVLAPCVAPPLAAATDYGPSTCLVGFVWRDAFPGDTVCVTPATRTQAKTDNAAAASRVDPNGAYGPSSCVSPFVWRTARPSDLVCVTVATRSQTRADNAAAASRRNSVLASYSTWRTADTRTCDGDVCTIVNDSVTLHRVVVTNVNVGRVVLGLYRLGGGNAIYGKTVIATPRTGGPGGIAVFRTEQLVCSGPPNAYFRVKDLTSGRRSDPKRVHTGCSSL